MKGEKTCLITLQNLLKKINFLKNFMKNSFWDFEFFIKYF